MAELDLDLLERLLGETTGTPWVWERTGLAVRASIYSAPHLLAKTACERGEPGDDDATAHLIVTAVNNLEPLVAEVRQLREANQRLRELLQERHIYIAKVLDQAIKYWGDSGDFQDWGHRLLKEDDMALLQGVPDG